MGGTAPPHTDVLISTAAPGVEALWAWDDWGSWIRWRVGGTAPPHTDVLISPAVPVFLLARKAYGGIQAARGAGGLMRDIILI